MLLSLAPMDGYTDCANRIIVKENFDKHNKEDNIYFITEFMSADGYHHNPAGVIKHMLHTEIDKPLWGQLFSGNKENLVQASIDLEKVYNYQGIDLNVGCPSPKIVKQGAGSGMLKDKSNTLGILQAIKDNITIPLSMKTRIGLNKVDKASQMDFLIEVSNICSMISLHGRTFDQGNSGEVDWSFLYELKTKINKDCKLIGNGGIKSYGECKSLIGNLDGLMIGQGSIGNPWVFTDYIPTFEEIGTTTLQHLQLTIAQDIYFKRFKNQQIKVLKMPKYEDLQNIIDNFDNIQSELDECITPIEFRKHLFGYLKGLKGSKEFKIDLVKAKDYYTLKRMIVEFFGIEQIASQ
ncbi:MAG: tRNA-dihydrouridine synthase [Candidatus Absconditabacteria bacterium]